MPPVDPRAAEIINTIKAFEQSVEAAEGALSARDWSRIDGLLSEQHRLTHALANLLEETREIRPPSFNEEVDRRIERISAQRADQLKRLVAFNHIVKERLTVISRSRQLRRGTSVAQRPRVLDLLQ